MKRAWTLALVLLAVPRVSVANPDGPVRNHAIGFGVAGGNSWVERDNDQRGHATVSFSLATAVMPNLRLGVETSRWFSESDRMNTYLIGVTLVPTGKGAFLRFGAGLADYYDYLGGRESFVENSFAALAALGYEWRFSRGLAVAPQIDFTYAPDAFARGIRVLSFGLWTYWILSPADWR